MSLSGNLRTMPFADLLQFLNATQNSGTLQIRSNQIVKRIFFEKGKIISSSSTDPREYLGHFLVSQNLITEEQLKMAMDIQRSSKMLLGKILVLGGKVNEETMMRMIRLKAQETVYSLFLVDEGEFVFHEDEIIDRLFIRVQLDPQSMIFEGVLRRDEWIRIREVFPHNNIVVEKVPGNAMDPETKVDASTRKVYEIIDGKLTIEDYVLALHTVEYVVCRSMHQLHEAGYIRIKKFHAPPKAVAQPAPEDYTNKQLLEVAQDKMGRSRFGEALDLLRQIPAATDGYVANIEPLIHKAEEKLLAQLYADVPAHKILELAIPLSDVSSRGLTPEEGFLISRIDGLWDVRSILSITPIKEIDALRLLKNLIDREIVRLKR